MIHDTFRYSCGLKHTKFKIQSPFKNFPIVQNVNYIQKYNTFFSKFVEMHRILKAAIWFRTLDIAD